MASATGDKIEVLVLNEIAPAGLRRFPAERYAMVREASAPEAILVRSQDLHAMDFGPRLKAIARAGAGVNNIPVEVLTRRGVPVFNAPGANANAVKELVIAGMLIAARNLAPALEFTRALEPGTEFAARVEDGKKRFAGVELPGQTLGVIGLGRVGSLVAGAAIRLGMHVLGYDPEITVDAAWSLPSRVRRAGSAHEVLEASDFVTLHVPLVEATRHLIDAQSAARLKSGAILLNFSRDAVVEEAAVLQALRAGRLRAYVTDFPSPELLREPGVVALPHLGASTREAEENCAVMVAEQLRDYLEHGNLRNAVNFPEMSMRRESPYRLTVAHANLPDMLARVSHALGGRGININTMLNKCRAEMAYTLVDVDSAVREDAIEQLRAIDGVRGVRYLPA